MKAWELLSKPGAWAQNSLARDSKGWVVTPLDEDAVCWCTLGAIQKCYAGGNGDRELKALVKVERKVGSIADWNDWLFRTQEEVVSVLKELDV